MKHVLIVYAHPEKTSFNAALLDTAVETLRRHGNHVVVSDLYAMNFNPVLSRNDIKGPPYNPDKFNYSDETGRAWSEGRIADDIAEEQRKVEEADLVIFQFPLQWMGLPAILKGWCDRIFLANYAFTDNEVYDQAKLKGRRAMLSFTTGAPESFYTERGPNGDINILLWPIQNGILRLVGFDVLAPQVSWSPQLMTADKRTRMLGDWEARLPAIWSEQPLHFVPIHKFEARDPTDLLQGLALTERTVAKEEESADTGLTIGQHLGRKLPKDSMYVA